jgi:hypothetical protein
MRTSAVDVVASETGEPASRRKSVLALGMAVLAAKAVRPGVIQAKKKGKNCAKKEQQRCSNDALACKSSLATTCQQVDPARCVALLGCCDQCSATGFLTCVAALPPV